MWSPSPGPSIDAVTKAGTHKGCPYGLIPLRFVGAALVAALSGPSIDAVSKEGTHTHKGCPYGLIPLRFVGATLVVALPGAAV